MTLQALTCPQCGSRDFEDTVWNTRRCQHCGTVSRLSDDRLRLEILVWACPKCGFNNEREVRFCAKCGQALLRNCPVCATETRSAAEFCENCGVNFDEVPLIVEWLQHIKGILGQYGASPSMVGTIAQGSFPAVFDTLVRLVGSLKIRFYLSHSPCRVKSANTQTGEIVGMMGSAWQIKWPIRVLIQSNTSKHRGVAVICTGPIFAAKAETLSIAQQILQAISAAMKTIPITHLM